MRLQRYSGKIFLIVLEGLQSHQVSLPSLTFPYLKGPQHIPKGHAFKGPPPFTSGKHGPKKASSFPEHSVQAVPDSNPALETPFQLLLEAALPNPCGSHRAGADGVWGMCKTWPVACPLFPQRSFSRKKTGRTGKICFPRYRGSPSPQNV